VRTLAIEINDAGIAVADSSGVLAIEPGYAVVERDRVVTGREAVAKSRLKPRQSSNRFWNALSTEPGTAGSEIANSAAEIAFTQLDDLWKRYGAGATDAVLVVPGQYRGEQLGLVLGLAHECGIPVRALIDTAAAASVRPYPGHQLLYVDAGLYRVAVTLVEQGNEAIAQAEQSLITTGLASLNEAFARRVAETFVRATRFDPLHRAETEQALYDRLPQWLEQLREQPQVELTLTYEGEEIKAVLDRASILGVAAGFHRALVQLIAYFRQSGQRVAIQLADRLAAQPGFVANLARLDDAHVETLPPGHAATAVLLKPELVPASGGQVKLLKRLAWRAAPADVAAPAPAEAAPSAARSLATHIVYAGVVYPVGARGIVVGREPVEGRRTIVVADQGNGVSRAHFEIVLRDGELKLRDLSRYGTFVNEKKVSGETTLERADVIRIGSPGAELQVVSIEDGGKT
jgi:FHA domain-containing protein